MVFFPPEQFQVMWTEAIQRIISVATGEHMVSTYEVRVIIVFAF